MRFVATKTVDQLDLQALHRVRERLVGQRTGIINQIRAFLLDRGVAVRQGLHFLRAELPSILANRTDVLSPRMLRIIEGLADDWHRLDARIEFLSSEIGADPSRVCKTTRQQAHQVPSWMRSTAGLSARPGHSGS
jgi:transposase